MLIKRLIVFIVCVVERNKSNDIFKCLCLRWVLEYIFIIFILRDCVFVIDLYNLLNVYY